jgi:hypothetical protein
MCPYSKSIRIDQSSVFISKLLWRCSYLPQLLMPFTCNYAIDQNSVQLLKCFTQHLRFDSNQNINRMYCWERTSLNNKCIRTRFETLNVLSWVINPFMNPHTRNYTSPLSKAWQPLHRFSRTQASSTTFRNKLQHQTARKSDRRFIRCY